MSHKATGWAREVKGIKLPTRGILQILAEHHNHKTGQCNPSIETLCEEAELKRRAVLGHLRTLEDAGLIRRETKSLGRAAGKRTDFVLNFSINEAITKPCNDDLQVQENARAKVYRCKSLPLQVQENAPALIEEPEKNRKYTSGREALDEIWGHLSQIGKDRSEAKSKLASRFDKISKSHDLDAVVEAFVKWAKTTDGRFHNGLQVIINRGQWLNWLEDQDTQPANEPTRQDWEQWANHLSTFGEWLPASVPPPGHPECKIPKDLLETIPFDLRSAA